MSVSDDIKQSDAAVQAGVPRIGVICGSDNNRDIVRDNQAFTNSIGNNDSLLTLKLLDPPVAVSRMHITPGYFRQKAHRWTFDRCQLVWTAISDSDQNAKTLDVAAEIARPLKQPIVNPPKLIGRTSRSELPRRLAGLDGVVAPKVLLIRYPNAERVAKMVEEAGFSFPAILRGVGTHNGEIVGVVDSIEAMSPIFGDRNNSYYLTEFVDVRRADGLYRKTRFFFVGDRIITRQHILHNDWLIHGRSARGFMAENEHLLAESRDMLIGGFDALPDKTRAALHGIRERVGLDYAGIDCCIAEDGAVVVFECNATMSFRPVFRNPATQHNKAALPRMLSALRRLIHAKTGLGPDA